MQKSYPIDRYDFNCYDKHFCLKPSALLIAAAAFLCRDFLLPIMIAATSIKGRSGIDLTFLLGDPGEPGRFFTAIPALLAIVAMARRSPDAYPVIGFLWRMGRWLLISSAAMQIYTASLGIDYRGEFLHYDSTFTLVALGADALILAYLLLSRRVRDTFSDYPQSIATTSSTDKPRTRLS